MNSPTILGILKEEAARNGYTAAELLKDDRRAHPTSVRQYAMWRAYRETGRSLSIIGRVFRRDHTTVINAVRKVEAQPSERRGVFSLPMPEKTKKLFKPALTYHGKPCRHGHGTLRLVRNYRCVVCAKEQDNRHYQRSKALRFAGGSK